MLGTQPIRPTVAVELNSGEIFNLDGIPCPKSDERIVKAALVGIANFVNSYPEFNNPELKEKLKHFRDDEIQIDMLHLAIEIINTHPRIIIVKNEANKAYENDDKRVFITYQNSVNSKTLSKIAINDKGIILEDSGNFEEYLRVLQVPLATINILERLVGQQFSEIVSLETINTDPEGPRPSLRIGDIYQPLLSTNLARRRCNFNCNRLSDTTRGCLAFFIAMAAFASIILLFSNKEEQH